ncbi:MAG TPA: deoxyguanosinetriphosphate triphosphohydrolase, partial [Pararhizobium sp.]|nr:deoxyguanosinetriphosphate triphosphohydrolase [Pararhizobium sp.]
ASLLDAVRTRYPGLDEERVTHELMRRQITMMVEDVISVAQARLKEDRPESVEDVRSSAKPYAFFSPEIAEADRGIKHLLYRHVYRHPDVMRVRHSAAQIVKDLFGILLDKPELMGEHFWGEEAAALPIEGRARIVADYLAGMTDTFAVETHRRLFDHTPDLR